MKGYRLTADIKEMDFELIHAFLSTSYWAKQMPRAVLQKAMANSLCFGLLDEDNNQVGFARLITDKATFAYLADVFILESHRQKGLSKYMVSYILKHPETQGLRRFMLATRDAHTLYEQFGFEPINRPEMLMQIHDPDVYLSENGKEKNQ